MLAKSRLPPGVEHATATRREKKAGTSFHLQHLAESMNSGLVDRLQSRKVLRKTKKNVNNIKLFDRKQILRPIGHHDTDLKNKLAQSINRFKNSHNRSCL